MKNPAKPLTPDPRSGVDTSSWRRLRKSAYHRILINCFNAHPLFLFLSNYSKSRSVAVDLNDLANCDAFCQQKLEDVASLVTLKLNDGTVLIVFDDGSIAAPGFFELA